ncbi:hypothetical protein [Streptomyces megasporus]|uniref:hypothetical protein n=1 Tax=Streptomyces megasporus TaxID=44060 RepID=UPI00068C8ABF|nr:hypothetical protein [Streptomyces megasporus]
MRKTVTGLALVAAAALLTGCGSDGGADKSAGSGGKDGAAEASARPSDGGGERDGESSKGAEGSSGGSSEGGAKDDEVTREVTLEVDGEGKTQVYYTVGTNATEQVTLPWSKTVTLSLTEAERKVGVLVSVVPGSVMNDSGELTAGSCVIKVDGKKVDDNGNGKDISGCEYTVK